MCVFLITTAANKHTSASWKAWEVQQTGFFISIAESNAQVEQPQDKKCLLGYLQVKFPWARWDLGEFALLWMLWCLLKTYLTRFEYAPSLTKWMKQSEATQFQTLSAENAWMIKITAFLSGSFEQFKEIILLNKYACRRRKCLSERDPSRGARGEFALLP